MTSSVVSAEQQCESIMVEKTAEAVGVVQSCADDLSTMQNRSAGYEMEGGGGVDEWRHYRGIKYRPLRRCCEPRGHKSPQLE